jgi:hypothetical protein
MAASLASSMAQNVYSLNVVGYANVTLNHNGFTLFANPMDGTMGGTVPTGNNLTNFFTGVPANSTIYPFIPSSASYGNPALFSVGKSGVGVWSGVFDVPPGTGFMFKNPATTNAVITFVGQVQQGAAIPVTTLLAGKSTMVGSPVPIGGNLTNSIVGLTARNGDSITTYDTVASWGNPSAFTVGKSGVGVWTANLQIGVGQGFLYKNGSTAANTWTANFTVQ